ncbi:acVLRF1 family peptidyl-tRNA hydrolase [Nocardioides mesophilus]|uniref:acVLRF1 family peptidyl-tRNA hydrolase n=1 Tax=Nocardioides mesophilus TaxID=433659 RepID=UPI001FE57916|nr:acVLRF1 family peptidyl-tRNA hydrolase [Nocardioides mesophilus]
MLVPPARVGRWFENFTTRHGESDLRVDRGCLVATAADGAVAEAALPFGASYGGAPDPAAFAAAVAETAAAQTWGLLLVRKGGFAVARVVGDTVAESKVGQRHVQGRTKAGGQSQQRFARRRDNQARQAYEAAAGHAVRILDAGPRLDALVCGGDRQAVEAVLEEPRLAALVARRTGPWLPVPDPRRAVLDQAVLDAVSAAVVVHEPAAAEPG